MKTLNKIGVAVALLLTATQFSFAQVGVPAVQAPAAPAAQAPAAPAAPVPPVSAVPSVPSHGSATVQAQLAAPATQSVSAQDSISTKPVSQAQDSAALAAAPAEPTLAAEPQAAEPAEAATVVVAPPAPKTPSEPLKIDYGARVGFGISGFNGHKVLTFNDVSTQYGIDMSMSAAYSIGFASSIKINKLISIAPELQLSYYSASGETTVNTNSREFERMIEASVYMYSIELPVMARFNVDALLNGLFLEIGPQFGYNIYSKIYKNNVPYKPDVNAFAFGPSIGGGKNVNGILAGIRCYYGIIEYAKNSDGYPWTVQASLTKFFF